MECHTGGGEGRGGGPPAMYGHSKLSLGGGGGGGAPVGPPGHASAGSSPARDSTSHEGAHKWRAKGTSPPTPPLLVSHVAIPLRTSSGATAGRGARVRDCNRSAPHVPRSRLAVEKYRHVDWQPHLPLIFGHVLRVFDLPVGRGGGKSVYQQQPSQGCIPIFGAPRSNSSSSGSSLQSQVCPVRTGDLGSVVEMECTPKIVITVSNGVPSPRSVYPMARDALEGGEVPPPPPPGRPVYAHLLSP